MLVLLHLFHFLINCLFELIDLSKLKRNFDYAKTNSEILLVHSILEHDVVHSHYIVDIVRAFDHNPNAFD